jgi:hypothetical protein
VPPISYADAPVSVRDDLVDAHQRAWDRLSNAGTWWNGAERVAIAAEIRNAASCPLCSERRLAESTEATAGEHASLGVLAPPAVEAVHQITSDPRRLSRTWFEKCQADGLGDAHYVELVGVVATVVSIDAFCRGLGVPLHSLPEPRAGEPTRRRPPGALPETAWVPMIVESRATGEEADLYGTDRTGNVLRALSLVPEEVRGLKDLSAAHYFAPHEMMDLRRGLGGLDRLQVELLAGRVSALNECFY